jgi:hypothetical protein
MLSPDSLFYALLVLILFVQIVVGKEGMELMISLSLTLCGPERRATFTRIYYVK